MSHIEDLTLEIDYLRGDLAKRDAEIERLKAKVRWSEQEFGRLQYKLDQQFMEIEQCRIRRERRQVMKPLEMIAEWRKGCSVAQKPEECPECTLTLINALEKALTPPKRRVYPETGTDYFPHYATVNVEMFRKVLRVRCAVTTKAKELLEKEPHYVFSGSNLLFVDREEDNYAQPHYKDKVAALIKGRDWRRAGND